MLLKYQSVGLDDKGLSIGVSWFIFSRSSLSLLPAALVFCTFSFQVKMGFRNGN